MFGLGSTDMKGFFAVVMDALREVETSKLTKPLIILATADEESTMCGAQSLLETNRRLGRHAIIGEPTGLQPARMHKGIALESVRLEGRSGHSSNPALGVNALEGMYQVIGEILDWRRELRLRYRNPLFEVEVPTLTGRARMTIPSGTQSGRIFRMRGKGIPEVNGYRTGDQLVRVLVWTPTKLGKREEALLRELGELDNGKPPEGGKGFFDKVKEVLGG